MMPNTTAWFQTHGATQRLKKSPWLLKVNKFEVKPLTTCCLEIFNYAAAA